MQKRPLCFLCIILIGLLWILRTSGWDETQPDEKTIPEELPGEDRAVSGYIYQCEYKEENTIYYLKRAVLSADSIQPLKIKNVKITCGQGKDSFWPGDFVCAKGSLKTVAGPTNPGQFDARTYYHAKKVEYTMWDPDTKLQSRPGVSLSRFFAKLRVYLTKKISHMSGAQEGGVLAAMLLGEKQGLTEEVKALFQTGGISHILAISGLHLSVLGAGAYGLFKRLRLPPWGAGILSALFLSGYGIFTGAGTATMRALILFLMVTGARIAGRTNDSPTALAVAAMLLLMENPDYLWYGGFLFSFLCVLSFLIFRGGHPLTGNITLYFFMAPVLLHFYYELPLYSILLNLFVVPTVGIVLSLGLAGCALGVMWEWAGGLVLTPALWLIQIYEYLCGLAARLPGASMILGQPSNWQIILYYGILALILFLYRKNRLRKRRFAFLFLMIPAWFILIFRPGGHLTITILDVGQGDCMAVSTPAGHHYLIDGGSSSVTGVGTYRILPYLKYRGIGEIEAVFVTHADGDHTSGIEELLEAIGQGHCALKINRLVLPAWTDISPFSTLCQLAERAGIPITEMDQGERMGDGEVWMKCLYPPAGDYLSDTNAGSLVMRLTYGKFSALFTGDMGADGEKEILGQLTDIDLLKTSHHGSKNSTSEEFLAVCRPDYALISAGKHNLYGHPAPETLERLEDAGCRILQTSREGAITFTSDGDGFSVTSYLR